MFFYVNWRGGGRGRQSLDSVQSQERKDVTVTVGNIDFTDQIQC